MVDPGYMSPKSMQSPKKFFNWTLGTLTWAVTVYLNLLTDDVGLLMRTEGRVA